MKKVLLSLFLLSFSFMIFGAEESKSEDSPTYYLVLQSREGEQFKISFEVARLSKFLENFVSDIEDGDKI